MKLLFAVTLLAFALAAPGTQRDQCGAKKNLPKYKYIGQSDTGFGCELCLDMVLIAETYAECDEAKVEHELEKKCDSEYPNGGAADKACRASVDKIAHEVIEDTNQNATSVCYKVIHKVCTYSLDTYNPYV